MPPAAKNGGLGNLLATPEGESHRRVGRTPFDSPVIVGRHPGALGTPSRSEALALVFLAALDPVVAARGSRLVLFALEIAVDDVAPDAHAPGVLKRLDVAANGISADD